MEQPMIPVATGELLDKITILEIKAERIEDTAKVRNVRRELEALDAVWREAVPDDDQLVTLRGRLKEVNEALWDIEDRIRIKEAQRSFDDEFIELARSVYRTNDQRADLKRQVNLATGSSLMEEKSYEAY